MTDQAVAELTRAQLAAQERSAPGKVTGKLRRAIDAMVWQGLRRDDAAAAAGLQVHSLREALRKPHVKQAYLAECEVLRVSGLARNIHRLEEIRDAANNMPAVQAIDRLMRSPDADQVRPGAVMAPGLVVQINVQSSAPMAHKRGDNDKPLIDHDNPPDVHE